MRISDWSSDVCSSDLSLQFDRSNQYNSSWSVESILSSDLDGPFNFLVGGIYADYHLTENSYYVNAFPIDYLAGVLGAFSSANNPPAAGGPLPQSFLATPFFRSEEHTSELQSLKRISYAVFCSKQKK